MPSIALKTYEDKLVSEVQKLVDTHGYLNAHHYNGRQGRRGLGHITRSGIVMLCASWERYIELVIKEVADKLIERACSPGELPKDVQKQISAYVKNHKDELRALDLAGDGWESVYSVIVEQKTSALNTPKTSQINLLCKQLLGVQELSSCWSSEAEYIDKFVSIRGGIAHTGSDATYVTINDLTGYMGQFARVVVETDNTLTEYVKELFPDHKVPWRRKRLD